MSSNKGAVAVNIEKIAHFVNLSLPALCLVFGGLGYFFSFYFHFLTVALALLTLVNYFYLYVQKDHTLLANFGLLAQARYVLESIGPEFRQYLFSSDTEEKPFNRIERAEVYRKAKGVDSSTPFGSQLYNSPFEYKLRHSLYPLRKENLKPFKIVIGKDCPNPYNLEFPLMIGAMSFGALGKKAVRALSRGARKAGIPMNTGEGGFPKYHLMENADLIFQMGTAKFGVRNDDGSFSPEKLKELAAKPQIKMIEIKLSQGAKPGKGGVLPKEKITKEISELRGVPMNKDVLSPPYHDECKDAVSTLNFIKKVQNIAEIPVGIKLCVGQTPQLKELFEEMKIQNIFPHFVAIDGAEGGTGAAPKSFMDDVGLPLFKSLPWVHKTLSDLGIREKTKIFASGKLISAGKQFMALSLGADAVYTARGFMLSLGCIQALECNNNACPVGITTHNDSLQRGLDIEEKSDRVKNYCNSLHKEYKMLLAAMGKEDLNDLAKDNLYLDGVY